MTERMSLETYRERMKLGKVEPAPRRGIGPARFTETPRAASQSGSPKKGRRTFAAVPTMGPDGFGRMRLYPSQKEAATAARLEQERAIGGIVTFLPQVSVIVGRLGDKNVRHMVDFLVIAEVRPDGSFLAKWVESKGWDVDEGRKKRRALEALTGCVVEVV